MLEELYLESYSQSYNLEEFKFSPVGLVPYTIYNSETVDIPPIEIYSSKKIEQRVLERVKNSPITSPIAELIEVGLNNKRIIVGYTNPSKFKFVYQKIKELAGLKREWGLGFYDYLDDTLYIILDDNITLFGNERFDLPLIIAHELCHMATKQNKKTKIIENTMNTILLPFFSNMIIHIIENKSNLSLPQDVNYKEELNKNKDILKKCILKLVITNEINYSSNGYGLISKILDNSQDIWFSHLIKIFPSLNDINIHGIRDVIVNSFDRKYIMQYNKNDNIFSTDDAIKFGYKKIGVNISNQIIGQETVYISEVLSIVSESGFQSNVLNSIKKIDMGK